MAAKQKKQASSPASTAMLADFNQKMEIMHKEIAEIKEINNQVIQSQRTVVENQKLVIDSITNQNTNLNNILAEQTTRIQLLLTSYWQTPKYLSSFPIKSEFELLEWEKNINEDNKQDMIKAVTTIMGEKGLVKGLVLIISQSILVNYNLDGSHQKKRIKDLQNIMDVLFLSYTSTSLNSNEPKTFEKDLRTAFKNAKNRHFKDACVAKKKQIQQLESEFKSVP